MRYFSIDKELKILKKIELLDDSFEAKKDALQKTEKKIRKLVGDDWENALCHTKDEEKLMLLLLERKRLLDRMFEGTKEECERMAMQNQYIQDKVLKLRIKMADICQELKGKPQDDYVDDYEVTGTLTFDFGDLEDINLLPEAERYGSNFPLMMSTIYMLNDDRETIEFNCNYKDDRETIIHDELEDGHSWAHDIPVSCDFDGICISHTMVDMCRYMLYSVIDVLQMKTVWTEVVVQYQNFGRR